MQYTTPGGTGLIVSRLAFGAIVLIGARDEGRGEEAARTLRNDGLNAHSLVLDVTDPYTSREAISCIDERCGRLDTLVNNAGISGDFDRQISRTNDVERLPS